MLIYVAMPILTRKADTVKTECKYWLGEKYSESIRNSLSDREKDIKYKIFLEEKQKEFNGTDFNRFSYLETLGNTEDHDEFNKAIEDCEAIQGKQSVVFIAQVEPFENRNGNKLEWAIGSFMIGILSFFILLLIPKFKVNKLAKFKRGQIDENTDIKEIIELLLPREGFYVTPILISLNVLVFLGMVISGFGFISFKGEDLLNWGGNYRPAIIDGEWWRLLTNVFMHGGLMHILANMYGLLFVGSFLEPILGKVRYLLVYTITGILASVASIWWYDATVSVGASGAIFGLYGFFLATLLLRVFPPEFGKFFLTNTLIFVGFNLIMGFAGGIDNAAHIGGLVSGFIIGLIMSRQLKQEIEEIIDN